jgi:hypothetical protein
MKTQSTTAKRLTIFSAIRNYVRINTLDAENSSREKDSVNK